MKWQVNDMKTVSVIMPVYNTEKYLSEAIESVLNQTYSDFELLLINDRSTDNSKQICIDYSKKDNRIRFFDNNTGEHGPGPTRNIGLDNAKGEYVYFMDSDDWIEKELLTDTVTKAEETGADIVQFGAVYEHENGKSDLYVWNGEETVTRADIIQDFCSFWKNNRYSLWMYLLKREKINSIRFESIMIGEDISFVMDVLCKVNLIAFIKKALYHYRCINGSTSHKWLDETIYCREQIWKHQFSYLDSYKGKLTEQAYSYVAYDNYIWAVYQLSLNMFPLSFQVKKKELRRLNEHMRFDRFRKTDTGVKYSGIEKIKYSLVRHGMEWMLLLIGPMFLNVARGE